MAQTTYLELHKPERTDFVSVVSDINDNMDIIDSAYHTVDTNKVPETRTVNGKALSSNITVGTPVQISGNNYKFDMTGV